MFEPVEPPILPGESIPEEGLDERLVQPSLGEAVAINQKSAAITFLKDKLRRPKGTVGLDISGASALVLKVVDEDRSPLNGPDSVMAKIDHHLHTSRYSPDSIIAPRVLIERALAAGLDGVVITEHDYQWEAAELADLATIAEGLVLLSGVEVSAREGHFLVYGLPDTRDVGPGIALGELLKVVRAHEAAIVAAHPFRWDQDFAGIVAAHGPVFDGVELVSNNVTVDTRKKAETLLLATPMGTTGSSDGHVPDAIGCYYSEFPGPIRTMAEFVSALRHQLGRPRHRSGAWQACGPVD